MMNIRKAQLKDIDHLIFLWNQLINYHKDKKLYFPLSRDWKEEKRRELEWVIKGALSVIYIIEEDKPIGYIRGTIHKLPLLYDIKYEGSIEEIFILSPYRRKGYGKKLMEALIQDFKKKEVEYININVDIDNEIGQVFWDALGFKTVSLKKSFKL